MSNIWTRERVFSLAPDAASASTGEALASPHKWRLLGRSDQALWGEIQGSGSKAYQTRIDLSEPAFKCSCPSRKFPCKHSLGLFFIYANDADDLKLGSPPGWVSEWLADRQRRAEKKAEKSEAKPAAAVPRDEEAAARRAAVREDKIAGGLDELSLWMEDLVRQGLGAAQSQPSQYWDQMAARLIDAQAPGLARRVRDLSSAALSGEGWQQRLLAGLGRLSLLVAAYRQLEQLSADLRTDVRTEVGWSQSQSELLAQPGIADTWCVCGRRITQEDQLRAQRTWLYGEETGRWALVLHFAAGPQPLDTSLSVGAKLAAELAFYPGAAPLRAIVKSSATQRGSLTRWPTGISISQALDAYSEALARVPWVERWPMVLSEVMVNPLISSGMLKSCTASDAAGYCVPLRVDDGVGWQLMAIGGGRPLSLFGEWDGQLLWPLSASADGRFFALLPTETDQSLVRVA